MSSPSSSYSSPCRRSPRLMSSTGSPGSSACGSGLRPNLSRRWSLDNISSQREGYVRDLRRQHNRDRVEVGRTDVDVVVFVVVVVVVFVVVVVDVVVDVDVDVYIDILTLLLPSGYFKTCS